MEDQALIEQFAEHGSESAFAELTQRYESFVFSTALRQVRDADLARDVVQNVFLCVARKAGALRREPVLAGWLGRATRFEALKLLRERRRRTQREQVFLASAIECDTSSAADEGATEQVQAALRRLHDRDRRALLLRFAEGKSLKEAAAILGISEDAAQKRISRALDKLRVSLARTRLSPSGLMALLGAPAVFASTTGATVAASSAGTSLFVAFSPLLAMAKLKVITITCAVAALTATPIVVYYLQDSPTAEPKDPIPATISDFSTKMREADVAVVEADALRAEVASLRTELAAAKEPVPESSRTAPQEPDSIAVLKQRAMNPQNDPHDRLVALRELRDRNGRDPQVAAAMATFARATTDPRIRADIFRQLNGMRDPSLKPVLLEALQQDGSEEVRQEAAETLAEYINDPAVLVFLANISRTDVDPEVRAQAVESLVKNASPDALQRMQNDPQATDLEIYHSTSALRKRVGTNAFQAALLLNVLKESKIPDLRKEIVEDLGKYYANIPEVGEWLDHLTATEQDPKVRREAANFSTNRPR